MPYIQCPFCLDEIQANCPTCEGSGVVGILPLSRQSIQDILMEEEAALQGGEWEIDGFGWGPEAEEKEKAAEE